MVKPMSKKDRKYYENKYKERVIKNLKKRAEALGLTVIESQTVMN